MCSLQIFYIRRVMHLYVSSSNIKMYRVYSRVIHYFDLKIGFYIHQSKAMLYYIIMFIIYKAREYINDIKIVWEGNPDNVTIIVPSIH